MTLFKRIRNYFLIRKYPFLLPRNVFDDSLSKDYDYSYTWYDALPVGWQKAFGMKFMKELKEELLKAGPEALKNYRILDCKEKYGELRWYDNGDTEGMNKLIEKYSLLSTCYCIKCGKPVRYITSGWIMYLCEECASSEQYSKRLTHEDIPVYSMPIKGTNIWTKVNMKKVYGVDFEKAWDLNDKDKK
jgi:hypothetical protein